MTNRPNIATERQAACQDGLAMAAQVVGGANRLQTMMGHLSNRMAPQQMLSLKKRLADPKHAVAAAAVVDRQFRRMQYDRHVEIRMALRKSKDPAERQRLQAEISSYLQSIQGTRR